MKTTLSIKMSVSSGNRIDFRMEPSGQVAVAELRDFDDDYKTWDVVGNNGWRGPCPESMLPTQPQSIWAVTTGFHGGFWSYDLRQVVDYLEKRESEFEPHDGDI